MTRPAVWSTQIVREPASFGAVGLAVLQVLAASAGGPLDFAIRRRAPVARSSAGPQ